MSILKLSQLTNGCEADFFVLFASREQLLTQAKKPYWRVVFRDETKEIIFPIWENSPWAEPCRNDWQLGRHYKVRASYRETTYGPQLDIKRIRVTCDADVADGFDPEMGMIKSPFPPEDTFREIMDILEQNVAHPGLLRLTQHIFAKYRSEILKSSAAKGNHHASVGGFLEHTRNVLRTTIWLCDQYRTLLPSLDPPLDKGVAAAGAALHDIGKLRELRSCPGGFEYTPEGQLIGHIVLGRDYIRDELATLRETEPDFHLDFESQLRLEHVVLSHQRLPEWGSPKPNMTPEALLVHYADDIDAKFYIMAQILKNTPEDSEFSDTKNSMRLAIFRGVNDSRNTEAR
ncbi:MAG: HD domain-containing protein [Planctomycetia bacterium]|nr:HD domain-containing protein [Planctomycetia bacterium]